MMAGSGRQFRVFVSSTFSDMHAEREVLQRRVFPRLQRFSSAAGSTSWRHPVPPYKLQFKAKPSP